MKRSSRTPRGMLLLEVLFWTTIMGVLMLLMTQMMISGMKIQKQTTTRDILIGRVDTALDAMRRDAWGAQSIQAIGSQVAFVHPEGVIFWRVEAGNILTRFNPVETPPKKTWAGMPAFTFSTVGPLLKVEVESGPSGAARHESITLASQRMLAGGVP